MKSSSKEKSNSAILKSPERATAESHRVWKRRYGWLIIWKKSIWLNDDLGEESMVDWWGNCVAGMCPSNSIIDTFNSIDYWFSHFNTYLILPSKYIFVHRPYTSKNLMVVWVTRLMTSLDSQIRIHSFSSPKFNVPIWSLRQLRWVLYLLVTTELLAIHQGEIYLFTSVQVLDR